MFEGLEITGRDPDGTRWFLSADEGEAREAEVTGQLRGVRARFERGGRRTHLQAGAARVERGDEIHLEDGVRMSWSEGFRIDVEDATYRRGAGVIVSGAPVAFAAPGFRVEGRGVWVDVEGRVVRVEESVRAVMEAVP